MAQLRAFVSHCAADAAFCHALVEALRTAGMYVWDDEHALDAGLGKRAMVRELNERPIFLVVLSQAALGSESVRNACVWALDLALGKPERQLLAVAAAPYDLQDAALLLPSASWRRVEASAGQPYPPDEAITRTLHLVGMGGTFTGTAADGEPQSPPSFLSGGKSTAGLIAQGQTLVAQGLYAEALLVFRRATRRNPSNGGAWAHLGAAHCELQHWRQALDAVERALALDATHAWVWHTKGWAMGGLGRYDEELHAYEQALARDPTLVASWNNRGVALRRLQRYDEALASLDRALALNPRQAASLNNRSNVLRIQGRHEEATAAIDSALAIEPNSALCWTTKGELQYEEQRNEEALRCFDHALTLNATCAEAWHYQAMALRALGRLGAAEQAERWAQELGWQPGHEP
jgi:tetratricopeptide (TPR) repeat protein